MSKAVSKSVSMTEALWALVEERAPQTPGKDRSGYITNLVEEDLRAAGMIPFSEEAADRKFFSKLNRALREDPKLKEQIIALLPGSARRRLIPA